MITRGTCWFFALISFGLAVMFAAWSTTSALLLGAVSLAWLRAASGGTGILDEDLPDAPRTRSHVRLIDDNEAA